MFIHSWNNGWVLYFPVVLFHYTQNNDYNYIQLRMPLLGSKMFMIL